MKFAILALALLLPATATATILVVYDPRHVSPERVTDVVRGSVGMCEHHASCLEDPDLSALTNVRKELWVHDNGTIRKGTRVELEANGFDSQKVSVEQNNALIRSLITDHCSDDANPSQCRTRIRRRTTD